jgi:CheY-like chemotaxis protein
MSKESDLSHSLTLQVFSRPQSSWPHSHLPPEVAEGDPISAPKATRAPGAFIISRVLIVDDERLIADSLAQILRARGHAVRVAYDGAEAIDAVKQECPEIVLTDVVMPRVNGVQAAIAIRALCPDTRIILFSGQAVTADLLHEARAAGHNFEIWGKPLHPRDLLRRLRG